MKLKKGQSVHLTIDTLTSGGEGLARHESCVVFVPKSLPGDQITAKVISTKPNYARALVTELILPSPQRIEPPCPYTNDCGGCQWQALNYSEQLKSKQQLLSETLIKVGKIQTEDITTLVQPVLGMETPFHYRNKGQFPFQWKQGQTLGGFYRPRSHEVIPIEECLTHHEAINNVFQSVKALFKKYKIPIYQEADHTGIVRHVLIRHGFTTKQTMVGFVVKSPYPNWEPLVQDLLEKCPDVVSVMENINPQKGNRILGPQTHLISGQTTFEEKLGSLHFKISLPSFFQINPKQTEVLYNTVLEMAEFQGSEHVLDAYAGTGSIALWLAAHVKEVTGIECIQEAVRDAKTNAKLNGIKNTDFKCGKVEDLLSKALEKTVDCVILDPPRKGCENQALEAIKSAEIPQIIYISCNPATLARDIQRLSSHYTLSACQPVDMFPHTHHLETVCLLKYKQSTESN